MTITVRVSLPLSGTLALPKIVPLAKLLDIHSEACERVKVHQPAQ